MPPVDKEQLKKAVLAVKKDKKMIDFFFIILRHFVFYFRIFNVKIINKIYYIIFQDQNHVFSFLNPLKNVVADSPR